MREQLDNDNLLPEQENALRKFLGGQNILVNLPTGYGKSLTFQSLPITADALFEKPHDSSVVISPLQSLVGDQIRHLNNMPELSRTKWHIQSTTQSTDLATVHLNPVVPERSKLE